MCSQKSKPPRNPNASPAMQLRPPWLRHTLSTGLPLVLSDIPPHAELSAGGVGDGAQVVAGRDPGVWAVAVERVAADLPAASQDALERAARYDLARMVERTVAVYRRATTASASAD